MPETMLKAFAQPSAAYRGKPFWAWNGVLEPDRLRRQIRHMKAMGLGGFFMHSRVGLATPYLGKDWFDCVDACVDEAGKQEMEAWLYDEDRWPSGAAGGLVTKDERYRMRFLALERLQSPKGLRWGKEVVAAFTATVAGDKATGIQRIKKGSRVARLGRGQEVLVFRVALSEPSDWFNYQTYLDTLNPEAVKRFLQVTHEAYRKHHGKDFGTRVPGIFTDEPNHFPMAGELPWGSDSVGMPWTERLPAVFKKRYGYDLTDHLAELFFDTDKAGPARYHFHDCVTHLFVEAFSKQIGQWCDKHGLLSTGHMLEEDGLEKQTRVVGSCMRHYEYMSAPGMDSLTQVKKEYLTAKQVSSAARQFGREWRLSELYGCTGWDFAFAGHKAVGDWHLACGINIRCQHLSWYTMLGQAKRDYPASIFYQSPWATAYKAVEDYFARCHAALVPGSEVRDLLVIHPVESMWLLTKLGWRESREVEALDHAFNELNDALHGAGLDFDYGDEELLSRHAKIKGGKDGPTFQVGKAVYKAVIVPPTLTLRGSTLKLLQAFQRKGGAVVFAGQVAGKVDAVVDEAALEFSKGCPTVPHKGKRFVEAVAPLGRRVSVLDGKGAQIHCSLHLLKESKDHYTLFVHNSGHQKKDWKPVIEGDVPAFKRTLGFEEARIVLHMPELAAPIELDPRTGERFTADATKSKAGWTIQTSLPALGSRLYVFPKTAARKAAGKALPKRPAGTTRATKTLRPKAWDVVLSEENVLVLDRPAATIGKGREVKATDFMRVDKRVRDALGLPGRAGRMAQPWIREPVKNPKQVPVRLRYAFAVKDLPSGALRLGLERPELYTVLLNGQPVPTDAPSGWWVDESLETVAIDPGLLRKGGNELILETAYSVEHPGLEMVYLLGGFGVTVRGTETTLTAPVRTLKLGDWTKQGLPFYSGHVGYVTTLKGAPKGKERWVVSAPDFAGVALRVRVDGKAVGVLPWAPYEIDITDAIPSGARETFLSIEVLGHRRNSHGPLHNKADFLAWVGSGQFDTIHDKSYREDYNLVPCGLLKPPTLQVRR